MKVLSSYIKVTRVKMLGQLYGIISVMLLFPKSLRNTWELMNFIGNMVGTLKSKNKSTPPTPPLQKKGKLGPS